MKKTVSVIEEEDGDIFGGDNSTSSYDWLAPQIPPPQQQPSVVPTMVNPIVTASSTSHTPIPPPSEETPPIPKSFESVPLTPVSPTNSKQSPKTDEVVEHDDLFSNSNTSYLQELSNQFSNTFLEDKQNHPSASLSAASFSNIPLTASISSSTTHSGASTASRNTPQPAFLMPNMVQQLLPNHQTPSLPSTYSTSPTLPPTSTVPTTAMTNYSMVNHSSAPLLQTVPMNPPVSFGSGMLPQQSQQVQPIQQLPQQQQQPQQMMQSQQQQPTQQIQQLPPQQYANQTNMYLTPSFSNMFQPIPSNSHTPTDFSTVPLMNTPSAVTTNTVPSWSLQSTSLFQNPATTTSMPSMMMMNTSTYKSTSSFDAFQFHRVPKLVTAFGFGGKLLVSNSQNKFTVYHLSTLANNTDYVTQYQQFPYPLFSFVPQQPSQQQQQQQQQQLVLHFIQSQIQYLEQMIQYKLQHQNKTVQRDKAHYTIWQLLYILVCNVMNSQTNEQFVDTSIMQVMQSILVPQMNTTTTNTQQQQQENDIVLHQIMEEEKNCLPMIEQYLLQGKMEDCYHYCLQQKLWSHAFILSSMISKKAFQNAILQFTKEQIPNSSSLKLLYGSFASQECNSVDALCNTHQDKLIMLQNWYKQLNGIIANGSRDMEKMIDSLGDALAKDMNNIEAAHFCYLISNLLCIPLQQQQQQNELNLMYTGSLYQKMILLGGDHRSNKRQYMNLNSLQKQEILEYILYCKAVVNKMTHFNPQYLIYRFVYIYYMSDLISNNSVLMDKFSNTLEQLIKTVEASKHKIHYHAYFVYQLQVLKHRFTASTTFTPLSLQQQQQQQQQSNRMSLGISSLFRKFIPGSTSTNTVTPQQQPSMPLQQQQQPIPSQQVSQPMPMQPQQQVMSSQQQENNSSKDSLKRSDSLWSKLNPFKRTASNGGNAKVDNSANAAGPRAANMGESNKLYYNEEIKRWIPIGADPKDYVEEAPPPPPDTNPLLDSSSHSSTNGIPLSNSSTDYNSMASSKYVGFGFATTAPAPTTVTTATPPMSATPPMAIASQQTSANPSPYPNQFFMPQMNTATTTQQISQPSYFMPSSNQQQQQQQQQDVPTYSSGYEIPQYVPTSFVPPQQQITQLQQQQ